MPKKKTTKKRKEMSVADLKLRKQHFLNDAQISEPHANDESHRQFKDRSKKIDAFIKDT